MTKIKCFRTVPTSTLDGNVGGLPVHQFCSLITFAVATLCFCLFLITSFTARVVNPLTRNNFTSCNLSRPRKPVFRIQVAFSTKYRCRNRETAFPTVIDRIPSEHMKPADWLKGYITGQSCKFCAFRGLDLVAILHSFACF